MIILFQDGHEAPWPQRDSEIWVPTFLIELPSWRRVFFGNLRDLLAAPFRREPALQLTSSPAQFWPDVFVHRQLPAAPFRKSVLVHILIVVALIGVSRLPFLFPRVVPQNPFTNAKIVYYPVSDYLPPINDDSSSEPAKIEKKGEPVYARQRIVSVPLQPDNTTQTIVTPSPLKIRHDVALPNIVAWTAPAPPAPANSVQARLTPPALPNAIAPPPDTQARLVAPPMPAPTVVAPTPTITVASRMPSVAAPSVVAPAPTVESSSKLPNIAAPAVVEPPPSVQARSRAPVLPTTSVIEPPPAANTAVRLGSISIGRLDTTVAAPHLPVAEQRAMPVPAAPSTAAVSGLASGSWKIGGSSAAPTGGAVAPAVAASSLAGMGVNGAHTAGQMIALGIHPVAPNGPIEIPQGSRHGTFAAGPEGRPDAPGTPDIHGGGIKEGPGGHGTGAAGGGAAGKNSLTDGITIAAGPINPGPVAVAGPANTAVPAMPSPAQRGALLAALRPPRVADIARNTRPGASRSPEPRVEDAVFGPKKFYSMTLNMPNLTSSGGSWIIRFAELQQSREKGDVTAPVATTKVDPAYPSDLIRDRVEGVVVLYAVIHSDGSVSEVRVLRGVDDRLDSNARAALLRWRFRPGTKNGNAVDLEAVVQIPFRARSSF